MLSFCKQFLTLRFSLCLGIVCIIIGLFLYVMLGIFDNQEMALKTNETESYKNAKIEIQHLKNSDFRTFFDKNIDVFFKGEGINGMIQRIIGALSTRQIGMFECHSIAHNIGHYAGYPDNFAHINSYATKENLDFCGSGFMHGVEGQLADNEYPQNIDDLYTFCKLALPLKPYYNACYHGAGHSFMENTRNPLEAVKQCDKLKVDTTVSAFDCYRGVFSENADSIIKSGKPSSELLMFCSHLEGDLQKACAQEINGFALPPNATQKDVSDALSQCINGTYPEIIQIGCVQSVAGVATDRLLGQGIELIPPDIVFTFSDVLIKEYISSTYGAFIKTSAYNAHASLKIFCESFPKATVTQSCFEIAKISR